MNRLSIKTLLTRSSLLMIARIFGAAVSFAGSLVIARFFGADTLGMVALCMAAMVLLAQAVSAGRPAVGPLFVSRYLVEDQPGSIRGFIQTGYRTIAVFSLLAIAVLCSTALVFRDALGTELTAAMVFACLTAPPLALINFNGGVLTGFRRQLLGLVPDLLIKPLLVLVAVVGIAAIIPQATYVALLAGICAALWATAGLQAFAVHRRRLFPAEPADVADATRWRETATPWIAIILLADYLVELHLLLAGWLLAPAIVGVLHICFRLRMLASFGMRALYSVILPDIYAAHARGDGEALASDITRGNAVVLAYTAAVCAAVSVFGNWFLGWFGDEFTTGYQSLVIICLSMIPRAVFGPATSIMAAAGRQKPMIVILVAGIAVSALTILATFGSLGFLSLAIGYTVSITFTALAQWWWTLRETGIDCSIFSALTYKARSGRFSRPRFQFGRS